MALPCNLLMPEPWQWFPHSSCMGRVRDKHEGVGEEGDVRRKGIEGVQDGMPDSSFNRAITGNG